MSWDWWVNDGGVNTLKGVEDDPDNPLRLDDEMIAYLLTTIHAARDGFNFMYPNMLPEEQERLDRITTGLPQFVALDFKKVDDNFQKYQNVAGVQTTGRRGAVPDARAKGGAPTNREIIRR